MGYENIAIFDRYLASSRVIYGVTVRYCKQSFVGPWQVGEKRRLLIAVDEQRSATHQQTLFTTGSLDVTPNAAEQKN